MTTPLVTVGVPFFDEERHLGPAVRSVLAQSERNLEILLVDDGSRDGSLAVARSFASDPRVRVIADGSRRRLPARLNQIVREARGTFVARMDADDLSHPRRLEEQLAVLAGGAVDVVGATAALLDDDERAFGVIEAAPSPVSEQVALERGILPHATIVARRAWFAANPYDETLTRAEDRDLWCRTWRDTRFGAVPDVRYLVRVTARDPGFLRGYLDGQRQTRGLFLDRGPRVVGVPRTARIAFASLAKSVAMRGAHALGLAPWLVRRRGRPPTERELRAVAETLASAQAP